MSAYLFNDVVIIFISFFIINYKGRLSFYHPGTLLLGYHIFNYTFRFYSVMQGASLAFSNYAIQGANEEELMRALFWADLALLSSSVAIAIAENKRIKHVNRGNVYLSSKIVNGVLLFSIPFGIWGALTQLFIPGVAISEVNLGEWSTSSYIQVTSAWFGLSFLALIYFKGFKRKFVIPLVLYLLVISVQGGLRYRLLLPILFLIVTYLIYEQRKWPKRWHFLLLLIFPIVFYPLKTIGQVLQQGGGMSELTSVISSGASSLFKGNSDDQSFLDQYAMGLSEIDAHDVRYFGGTIAPLLYSPIPRTIWPDKPNLAQWVIDISSRHRPFGTIGAALSLYGEAYANFGYAGILIIPFILFYFLTRFYKNILTKRKDDIQKFFYVVIFVCLIQVMRDGLYSLVVFPVINSMPLFLIYILHKMFVQKQIESE